MCLYIINYKWNDPVSKQNLLPLEITLVAAVVIATKREKAQNYCSTTFADASVKSVRMDAL